MVGLFLVFSAILMLCQFTVFIFLMSTSGMYNSDNCSHLLLFSLFVLFQLFELYIQYIIRFTNGVREKLWDSYSLTISFRCFLKFLFYNENLTTGQIDAVIVFYIYFCDFYTMLYLYVLFFACSFCICLFRFILTFSMYIVALSIKYNYFQWQ